MYQRVKSGALNQECPHYPPFYRFLQTGDVLEEEHARRMGGETVAIGGSERGFYSLQASNGRGNAAMLLLNGGGQSPEIRDLSQALETLVMNGVEP